MRYVIVVERCGNGYSAYAPDLPGCVAAASTKIETGELMREAIELHLADMKATGQAVPRPSASSRLVQISKSAPLPVLKPVPKATTTNRNKRQKSSSTRKPVSK